MAGLSLLERDLPGLEHGRWGRTAAQARLRPLHGSWWRAMPIGLGVLTLMNLAQLLTHWSAYRQGPIVLALLAASAGCALLVHRAATTGLGPLGAAVAVLAGPVGCVVMASQVSVVDLAGLANWMSGYSAAVLVLLPFTRPAEEWIAGVALLAVTQGVLLRDAPATARSLHAVVLSAGAAPTIVVGAALYAAVLRRAVVAGQELIDRQREAAWRETRIATLRTLQLSALSATEAAAAQLLEDVAAQRAACRDPAVVESAERLVQLLRRELRARSARGLLQSLVAARTQECSCLVEVDDEHDLAARFPARERILVVDAVVDAAIALTTGTLQVTILDGDTAGSASVTVFGRGGPRPDTPSWRTLLERPDHRMTSVQADRWFSDLQTPLLAPGGDRG